MLETSFSEGYLCLLLGDLIKEGNFFDLFGLHSTLPKDFLEVSFVKVLLFENRGELENSMALRLLEVLVV